MHHFANLKQHLKNFEVLEVAWKLVLTQSRNPCLWKCPIVKKEGRLLLFWPLFSVCVFRSSLMHLWRKREQESCVEEPRIKLECVVLCAGVFGARIEQMHTNWLSLKQEVCMDWACWADMGRYSDRCQEYEGKLGFVRDMGDTWLISWGAQRTVS